MKRGERIAAQRKQVALLKADGKLTDEQIALVMGKSLTTLRRQFERELANAEALAHGQNILRQLGAAEGGSTSAMKQIGEMVGPRLGPMAPGAPPEKSEEDDGDMFTPRPLGKKEQEAADAQAAVAAGGVFAPAAPPKRSLN